MDVGKKEQIEGKKRGRWFSLGAAVSLGLTGVGALIFLLSSKPDPRALFPWIREIQFFLIPGMTWVGAFVVGVVSSAVRRGRSAMGMAALLLSVCVPLRCWYLYPMSGARQAELVAEAERGDVAAVARGIASGLPVDAPGAHGLLFGGSDPGQTGLTAAAERGQLDVVKLLVSKGANVNQLDGRGRLPLSVAGEHGKVEIIDYLLGHGADVNGRDAGRAEKNFASDVRGTRALHLAARHGEVAAVKRLLAGGAEVNAVSGNLYPYTPLQEAMESPVVFGDQAGVARVLAEAGADGSVEDEQRRTPILMAAGRGDWELVVLLAKKPVRAAAARERFCIAVAVGDETEALKILHDDPEIARGRMEAGKMLKIAVLKKMERVIEELTAHDAVAGDSMRSAVVVEDEKILVLAAGNDVAKWNRILWEGARTGRLATVEIALKHGAGVNALTVWRKGVSEPALFAATENGHLEVVEYLLAQGAEVNAENVDEFRNPSVPTMTAVDVAVIYQQVEVLKVLAARGGVGHRHPGNMWAVTQAGLADDKNYLRVFGQAR